MVSNELSEQKGNLLHILFLNSKRIFAFAGNNCAMNCCVNKNTLQEQLKTYLQQYTCTRYNNTLICIEKMLFIFLVAISLYFFIMYLLSEPKKTTKIRIAIFISSCIIGYILLMLIGNTLIRVFPSTYTGFNTKQNIILRILFQMCALLYVFIRYSSLSCYADAILVIFLHIFVFCKQHLPGNNILINLGIMLAFLGIAISLTKNITNDNKQKYGLNRDVYSKLFPLFFPFLSFSMVLFFINNVILSIQKRGEHNLITVFLLLCIYFVYYFFSHFSTLFTSIYLRISCSCAQKNKKIIDTLLQAFLETLSGVKEIVYYSIISLIMHTGNLLIIVLFKLFIYSNNCCLEFISLLLVPLIVTFCYSIMKQDFNSAVGLSKLCSKLTENYFSLLERSEFIDEELFLFTNEQKWNSFIRYSINIFLFKRCFQQTFCLFVPINILLYFLSAFYNPIIAHGICPTEYNCKDDKIEEKEDSEESNKSVYETTDDEMYKDSDDDFSDITQEEIDKINSAGGDYGHGHLEL